MCCVNSTKGGSSDWGEPSWRQQKFGGRRKELAVVLNAPKSLIQDLPQ
jgi:hypothetical protein